MTLLVSGFILIRNSLDNKTSSSNEPSKEKKPNPSDAPNNPPLPKQPSDRYRALVATKKEQEYKSNPPLPISSVECGTDRPDLFTYNEGHLVAGSALLTDTLDGSGSGSSILNSQGITHIIHAVNQPFSAFNNNEEFFISYVVKSVQNSIILADRNNFEELAIPFVGGGIYLGSCDPEKLAEGIIRGAVNQLEKCQSLRDVRLIDWESNPQNHFLAKVRQLGEELFWEPLFIEKSKEFIGTLKSDKSKGIDITVGDIRKKKLHKSSVIVNAANTQVQFGGGISGAIAEQVGNKAKIEAKSQELIGKFNQN